MAKKSKKVSTISSEPKEALQAESSVLESNPEAEIVEPKEEAIVKVMANIPFYDLEAQMNRDAGCTWEVKQSRADLLVKLSIAIVL